MKLSYGFLLVSLFALFTGCGGGLSGGGNSPFAGTGKVGTFDCTYHNGSLKHLFDVTFDIDGDGRFVNGQITHRVPGGQVMTNALKGIIGLDQSVVFEVKEGKVPGTSVHTIHRINSNTQEGEKLVMETGTPSGRCHVDLSGWEWVTTPVEFQFATYRLTWE